MRGDPAAEILGDPAAQREADPRPGILLARVQALEELEDPLVEPLLESDSVVFHLDAHPGVPGLRILIALPTHQVAELKRYSAGRIAPNAGSVETPKEGLTAQLTGPAKTMNRVMS